MPRGFRLINLSSSFLGFRLVELKYESYCICERQSGWVTESIVVYISGLSINPDLGNGMEGMLPEDQLPNSLLQRSLDCI
jgi:hypothetical protein